MAIASRVPKRVLSTFAAEARAVPEAVAAVTAVPLPTSQHQASERTTTRPLEFDDTARLFAGEPTSSLVRTLAALQALSVGPLVDVATAALRSPAIAGSALGKAAARATAYRHFCAGETAGEAAGVASVCIKITALCPIALLEKTSDLLRWQLKHPSLVLPWKTHSFPILSDSSPLYLTPSEPPALTADEERELELAHDRPARRGPALRGARHPAARGRRVRHGPARHRLLHLRRRAGLQHQQGRLGHRGPPHRARHHPGLPPRHARDRLEAQVRAAEKERVRLGLKVVRGAYMAREARLASSLGVPSPVHGTIQDTHDCYNGCAAFLLDRVRRGHASVMLATHNVESGQLAAARAQELGVAKSDPNLQFAQLMGMADGLSLSLRNAGFQVSKYLPYGPVDQIIPYLIRRAEENRGMLSASSFDRQLLRKELVRRVKTAVVGRE
ncbi:hypothetical protein PR202_ga07768 [Eleusine coracana subsp. coracana]|uniref:Proline dehydrogenase n=1 Tax=Eleusine coracana subsp. coracana TaxID=191504 RepID=A0AAV5C1I9_ELECO|nr:hypothetical protein PR202_ga07768 [Eleusine coracana subsp. coracana]